MENASPQGAKQVIILAMYERLLSIRRHKSNRVSSNAGDQLDSVEMGHHYMSKGRTDQPISDLNESEIIELEKNNI